MNLDYAIVCVGDKKILNHTKIKKEDAFEIIKQNSLNVVKNESIEHGDEFSFPVDFDLEIKKILELKNVFATPYEQYSQFSGDEFIGEFFVSAFKIGAKNIIDEVKKYVDRGAEIYLHSYYIMTVDTHIDDELTVTKPYFWFKIGLRKKL